MSNLESSLDGMDPLKALALLRVVIAAAWADGEVQPQEWLSLQKLRRAVQSHPDTHAEIESLLSAPISPRQYRQYVQSFVDLHPSAQDRRALYGWVKQIIYADNEISLEEAYILDQLGALNQTSSGSHPPEDQIATLLQDFKILLCRWIQSDSVAE